MSIRRTDLNYWLFEDRERDLFRDKLIFILDHSQDDQAVDMALDALTMLDAFEDAMDMLGDAA